MKLGIRTALVVAFSLTCALSSHICFAEEAQQLLLWPDGAPGSKGDSDEDKPCVWVYPAPADKATGTAVVICPGGGYAHLALDHEGSQVAEMFNDLGVTACVLRYRLGKKYQHPTQMGDVQRALRLVRSRAEEWHIDPQRVGIMGFSAGGHLASTAATHFDDGKADAADPIDRLSCRPDFAVLAYPVITLDGEFAHAGSRKHLLGDKPDAGVLASLNNDTQVTAKTPPTFLFHTADDPVVPVGNSILFFSALNRAKVPAELHIYEKGKHGVGLARDNAELSTWTDRLAAWLKQHHLLDKQS